jgi:hypothetical protein
MFTDFIQIRTAIDFSYFLKCHLFLCHPIHRHYNPREDQYSIALMQPSLMSQSTDDDDDTFTILFQLESHANALKGSR